MADKRTAATTTEVWTCAGRRLLKRGKLSTSWVAADGTERWFSAKRRYALGGSYQVEVIHAPGCTTMHGEPVYMGDADVKSDQLEAWSVMDASALTNVERHRAESAAKRDASLLEDMTLRELRRRISQLSPSVRRGTFAWILDYLVRP